MAFYEYKSDPCNCNECELVIKNGWCGQYMDCVGKCGRIRVVSIISCKSTLRRCDKCTNYLCATCEETNDENQHLNSCPLCESVVCTTCRMDVCFGNSNCYKKKLNDSKKKKRKFATKRHKVVLPKKQKKQKKQNQRERHSAEIIYIDVEPEEEEAEEVPSQEDLPMPELEHVPRLEICL